MAKRSGTVWFGPLVVAAVLLGAVGYVGRLGGQTGEGGATWSGRIRVERTHTMKTHCTKCEHDVHDFELQERQETEYQVEGIPLRGPMEFQSDDVRVTVKGNKHSRSHGVNYDGASVSEETLLEDWLDGSGATNAGVTVFLRQGGEADRGTCRVEFSPIGQREDHGPLSKVITIHGKQHFFNVSKGAGRIEGDKPAQMDMGPEGDGFDVPCAPGAKALRGDKVTQNEGGVYRKISWDLTQDGELKTEVVMTAANGYEHWLPQAGEDEKEIGDFIDVRIVAQEKGKAGSRPPLRVLKYTVSLVDVSKEPGVCLNWPPAYRAKKGPDLKIDGTNPYIKLLDEEGQKAETKEEGLEQFMVTVNSHDWGAYGKLQVVAELEDHSTVVGHVEGQASTYALALPKDENSNHVADWWEHWFELKNTAAEADDDKTPLGDGDDGDSITLYEEYRGFRVQGQHERTSPEMKDLFVYDFHSLGLGYFGTSGLQTHRVSATEYTMESGGAGNTTSVTKNRGTHTKGAVWAIKLKREVIGEGAAGETEGGPGVPKKIEVVRIDTARIAAAAGPYAAAELKSTIAHELGHAVNIWHHGTSDYFADQDVLCRHPKKGTVTNMICAGKECFGVAAPGGAFSGNDKCILRYDSTDLYEDAGGNCEWKRGGKTVKGRVYGYDPPGTLFCDSGKGTGLNDTSKKPNKAGDAGAGFGSCIYKFCVNNERH